MKDYELVASLNDAQKNKEDHLRFIKEDGTTVDVTVEKYNTIPDSFWIANY